MDLPYETVDRVRNPQSESTAPNAASEMLIASADAKLQELQGFGFKVLLIGLSPEKFIGKPTIQGVLFWLFLIGFFFAYATYQIVVALFFARNLLEVVTNLYIASYLGSFFFQWSYVCYILPKLYTDRISLADYQCARACPEVAEKIVADYWRYIRIMIAVFTPWLMTNVMLHLCGPLVEAVLILIQGGQVEGVYMLPQVFTFPVWGQVLMYFYNAIISAFLIFYCIGSYTILGVQVAKIKILCEVLNEALERAPDNRRIRSYIDDHVRIIKRAKELTQQLAKINLFIMTSTYFDFATQMFIVTLFDANLSYYVALAYSMSSIFLLMAAHCFMGTEITHSLESVANGSYSSKWYDQNGLSKHVILMTQMSQNKLEQTILLGSLKVERATALNLLRSSYAAYTVLKVFQEK